VTNRIAIIGGLGHVGLPFGLVLASVGYEVVAIDRKAAEFTGRVPFVEHGAQELLDSLPDGAWTTTASPAACRDADTIIVTIGTPLDEHQNPRLGVVLDCLGELLPYLRNGQHIMLRSTVFPGTTRRVNSFLMGAGLEVHVSFCPERIVQGHAIRELRELPAIVSGCTAAARDHAVGLFAKISHINCVQVEPEEAELAKLMLNSWRYIQFGAGNQFYAIAQRLGVNYAEVMRAMKSGYPRARDLPGPGFAAGPCLAKDTLQLSAAAPEFRLGTEAWHANERMPELVLEMLAERGIGPGSTVGILGMAFKADNDDTRESLSFKLKKLLEFRGIEVLCSDEHAVGVGWVSREQLVELSHAIVIGVPHAAYRGLDLGERVVVDLWGVTK
jgi:UDP-N-acetyl-D-mannosaminuronic acid dehydrogenase